MLHIPGLKQLLDFDKEEKIWQKLAKFMTNYVDQHKVDFDENNTRDLLDLMLLENKKTTDQNSSFHGQVGEMAMVNNMIDLFVAGMETTSSAILWTILYLVHHPEIQAKVHKELNEVKQNFVPYIVSFSFKENLCF